MDYEELLSLLDIETSADFVYFEQFAELIESAEDITQEAITQLVTGTTGEVLAELTEGYFEDILQFVPDEEDYLFTLLQTIRTTLAALAQNSTETEDSALTFAEELFKFRNWYTIDSRVLSTDREEGFQREIPLMEALINYRVRNFAEDEYDYDFSGAQDYPLGEYIVPLSTLVEAEEDMDDNTENNI